MAATRVAIITGSSQGIGAAVADRLARDGLAVAINYAGNEAPARALADKITDRGGHAIAVQANVNGPEALSDNVAALGMILSAEHAAALDAVSGGNENLLYGLSRPPLRNQVVFGGAEVLGLADLIGDSPRLGSLPARRSNKGGPRTATPAMAPHNAVGWPCRPRRAFAGQRSRPAGPRVRTSMKARSPAGTWRCPA